MTCVVHLDSNSWLQVKQLVTDSEMKQQELFATKRFSYKIIQKDKNETRPRWYRPWFCCSKLQRS